VGEQKASCFFCTRSSYHLTRLNCASTAIPRPKPPLGRIFDGIGLLVLTRALLVAGGRGVTTFSNGVDPSAVQLLV